MQLYSNKTISQHSKIQIDPLEPFIFNTALFLFCVYIYTVYWE